MNDIHDEWDAKVASGLSFLRKRLTGQYQVDDFGFDSQLTEYVFHPLLRQLYHHWFRTEVYGIDNLPNETGALVVGNHSGTIALDALMLCLAVHDEHPAHRYLRLLAADFVFRLPLVSEIARKSGATLACNPDVDRLLHEGHLVGVFPEGFKGSENASPNDTSCSGLVGRASFRWLYAIVRPSSRPPSWARRRLIRCSATSNLWHG